MSITAKATEEKFALLADLGEVTVVKYPHLEAFREENKRWFWEFETAFMDKSFKYPSRTFALGDKFHVQAFGQVVPGETTVRERMDFCRRREGNVFVGAQGIPLMFNKRELLPKGLWYGSFDEEDRLWRDRSGCRSVPNLVVLSKSDLCDFNTRCIERPRDTKYAFFSFRDLSASSA